MSAIALAVSACASSPRLEVSGGAAIRSSPASTAATEAVGAQPPVDGGLLPPATGAGDPGALPGPGEPDAAPSATGGVIKLGTVLPLQGGQRDFGEPILRTTQAFVDELNARGGVAGHRVELIAYNACLLCQDEALQAVRRLVEEDGVFALVNTYVMVVAFQPVIPYLVEHGVPLVQGGAENQTSDALSPVNFATAPPGAFYAKFLPAMAAQHAGLTRVGLTYLDVPSEANGVPILREELERAGVEVVREEPIGAAEEAVTNMDAAVTRMRAAGAEGVVAINPVLLIYGRLAADRQEWQVPWVGLAAWSELVEEGCGSTCDDLVLTDTAGLSYPDRDSPQMRQFVDTMARRYPGGQITGHTLAAWVGMQLTTEVVGRVGHPDRAAFLAEMEQVRNLDLGTTSPLTFTPDRHLGGTASILLKFRDGRYYRFSDPLSYGEIDG